MVIEPVHIVGGGLAGSEAAWQMAQAGVPVIVHEMRGVAMTDVHTGDNLAELVCSNSFRSDDYTANAVGVLHEEMRRADSLIILTADQHRVPAGSALAVDRDGFSAAITQKLATHPLITIIREEITDWPQQDKARTIIASGPLTSPALANAICDQTGHDKLAFFDAIAPIIHFDSIDMSTAWRQSRYDKGDSCGGADAYINCPMNEGEYTAFIDALLAGDKTVFRDWEKNTPYFEGCLPVEVMAERGRDTLRHGPMKPVGLTNRHKPDIKPYAIVQLRQDNALGTLWNMVGFQTKLKYSAQTHVFRMIPGLEKARFARLGGIHKNTFLNAPALLDAKLRLRQQPGIWFAGQITGVEGYVESAAMGLLAGRFAACDCLGLAIEPPPPTTAHGALLAHITGGHRSGKATFQPMNINFGLFPPISAAHINTANGGRPRGKDRSRAKKSAQAARALYDMDAWLAGQSAWKRPTKRAQQIPVLDFQTGSRQ